MKKLLITLALILLSTIVFGQFKTVINPEQRIATLKNDTLFVHLPLDSPIRYANFQHRYITFNGKVYRYKIAYYDPSLFYIEQQQSKKKSIKIFKK